MSDDKKKKAQEQKEENAQEKRNFFDSLPVAFKNLMEEAASGERPFGPLDYLADVDYKKSDLNISGVAYLLMVQETFGSAVTPHLYYYSSDIWKMYEVKMHKIFGYVEKILEDINRTGTICAHRTGESFLDDPVTSLAQNMWIFLLLYYDHFGMKEKAKKAKKEILDAVKRNTFYALHHDDVSAGMILEEFKERENGMDFFFGDFYHYIEPLASLVEDSPLDPATIELFSKYLKYLDTIGQDVKARVEYEAVVKEAREIMEYLYSESLEAIQNEIEYLENRLIKICKKRNKVQEKMKALDEKRNSPFSYFGCDLPF